MRPVIDNLVLSAPLTVGTQMIAHQRYALNTSRADGLMFHILPSGASHHANIVITVAQRVFTLPIASLSDMEDLIDRIVTALHITNLPHPIILTQTVTTEDVRKSNTLVQNQKEKNNGKLPKDQLLTTEVTRRITMQHPTTFGAPPGFMTLSYAVIHKDDPHYQFVHSLDAQRTQLLKLFTTMQNDYYG